MDTTYLTKEDIAIHNARMNEIRKMRNVYDQFNAGKATSADLMASIQNLSKNLKSFKK